MKKVNKKIIAFAIIPMLLFSYIVALPTEIKAANSSPEYKYEQAHARLQKWADDIRKFQEQQIQDEILNLQSYLSNRNGTNSYFNDYYEDNITNDFIVYENEFEELLTRKNTLYDFSPLKNLSDDEINKIIDELTKKLEDLSDRDNVWDANDTMSVEEAIIYLEENDMPVDENFAEMCSEIEKYKKNNPDLTIPQIACEFDIRSESAIKLRANSYYDQWYNLTESEKTLIVKHPINALETDSCRNRAYELTTTHMGTNGLGDKSDGFRHGIWNALMARNIDKEWALLISTAHEDIPESELNKIESDGFYKWQHRDMDLHNNKIGTECVNSFEEGDSSSVSDSTLVARIKIRISLTNNKKIGIIWLHE